MAKYLSKTVILAAYRELSKLTDNPELQGQTQIVSGLRYAAALSRFAKVNGRDFDTRDDGDKKLFNSYVSEVVALNGNEATKNFYEKITNKLDSDINSNFYSAGVVTKSLNAPDREHEYPRRNGKVRPSLFKVKNGVLLIASLDSGSVSRWFEGDAFRVSFIVWLCRNLGFPDDTQASDLLAVMRSLLLDRYTSSLVEGLWGDGHLDIESIDVSSDLLFADEKSVITGEDIEAYVLVRNDVEKLPRNWIFFGAPGTGKSYQLDKLAKDSFVKKSVRRVTFYPDYTYSQFVGCFKPYSEPGSKEISYEFVEGPFLETYLKAITHPYDNYVLLIEELNRANPAAVFGDVFQLLDRDENGDSVYPVATSREMADCIGKYFDGLEDKDAVRAAIDSYYDPDLHFDDFCELSCKDLCLPPNMYIWATMNSADQGVFPMDTAFKRRWEFKPMGINDGAEKVLDDGRKISEIVLNPTIDDGDETVPAACGPIVWDKLRRKINDLMKGCRVNEDKFLGPFFISPADLTDDAFVDVFKNKVLLYLFEDIGKMKCGQLFEDEDATYSELCEQFDKKGVRIFKGINPVDVAPDESVGNSQASSGDDLPASNEALEG